MTRVLFLILFVFSCNLFSQKVTYSKYEEEMVFYVNNQLAYANKYDSLEIVRETLDSCWHFIEKYPNSFAKSNVFSYMLESTILLTDNPNKINPLVDSVLFYDKIASTRLRVGEILIKRNIDIERGRNYVVDAFPKLTVMHHKFRAYMLMASSDVALGNFASAQNNYKKALQLEPERISAWYEYYGFSQFNELSTEKSFIKRKIKELEEKYTVEYENNATKSNNINKSIYTLTLPNIDGNNIALSKYQGNVIVINKFNFWCGHCVREFSALKIIIREFPQVVFLFVNAGESSEELQEKYFTKNEFSFLKNQQVLFMNKEFFKQIDGQFVPHTMVIDKKGKIRYDYAGYQINLEKLLRANLRKLSNE